jgi:preprotein translocase subunit SecA
MELLERIWELLSLFFGGLMRGFERAITSLFGSSNARYIKRLQPKVEAINALESKYQAMSDEELEEQTAKFRQRLAAGETVDDLLIEAFAVCREAGRRFLDMRHYDVQLIGGMVLHGSSIAEMVTGEGKTLVATLPAYLNALEGKGVHVVTVNDYLARRDMEWMGPLYLGLGLTVGAIQSDMEVNERQKAYACDITYGTNNEFGFDYLRDNMRPAARGDDRYPKHLQQSQGPLHYAIIDEVDNILVDEARTPLIISGPAHDDVKKYAEADRIARQLKKDEHFVVNEKDHTAHLTDDGVRHAEKLAGVESFYTAGNMQWPHLIDNSLKAHHLYKRDVNYVVKEGRVVIVDEFTGRLMEGRQWSDGLHQSVEAKEGVKVKEETQTLATITLQNFFKLYDRICGMTGTAMTEANEFWKIYKLDVIAIPTNKPMRRTEHPDGIYRTEREKYIALADDIERCHKWDVLVLKDRSEIWGTILKEDDDSVTIQPKESKQRDVVAKSKIVEIERKGRPVLVGTVSIEKSERLSSLLERRGIKHEVLNAKHHKREAEIVAQAGRKDAVTIATNMAGRGTDIVLGGNAETMAWALLQDKYETRLDVPRDEWDALVNEIEVREKMREEGAEVKQLGGLSVMGTERHEARRIDLQLRGRCGRQGDPGSSRFYLSLEDDLMRIFAGEWVKGILDRLGMQEGEKIESRMVTRRIEAAQKKVEERNFEVRKNLLEYDEVMDEQRKRVYSYRQKILNGVNCRDLILEMIGEQVEHHLDAILARDFGVETYASFAGTRLTTTFEPRQFRGLDAGAAETYAKDEAIRMSETEILGAIEENLPVEEDEDNWSWEALAKFANVKWNLNLRDRDLKKFGREGVAEMLIEHATEAIQKVDLSEGAPFLEDDFSLRAAVGWVKHKFGFELEVDEIRKLEAESLKKLLCQRAQVAYDDKESEYPVMAGLYRFSSPAGGGQTKIDRDALVAWARERFDVELDIEDLKHKQRDEIRAVLIDHSRAHQQLAKDTLVAAKEKVVKLFESSGNGRAGGNGMLSSLCDWAEQNLQYELPADEVVKLGPDELETKLVNAVEDRYHPEMRRMERMVLLQIVDTAWKDHLLTMDYLRSSVALKGWAQLDPKVEYKREGMRLFEQMWTAIGERVTDLIFHIQQLDEGFVGSTWTETAAVHEQAQSTSEIAQQQQAAIDASRGDVKLEPIRNRGVQVGRNEPCPCGSGKKFKQCCMRNRGVA